MQKFVLRLRCKKKFKIPEEQYTVGEYSEHPVYSIKHDKTVPVSLSIRITTSVSAINCLSSVFMFLLSFNLHGLYKRN